MNSFKKILFLTLTIVFVSGCSKEDQGPFEKGTITDVDGNIYITIKIGNQWWMQENLRTTKYSNGDIIGTTLGINQSVVSEVNAKYNWSYLGNEGLSAVYGRLYTWNAVTETRKVCPLGWHLPSDGEWTVLSDFLTTSNYGYQGDGNDIAKSMASKSGWLLHGVKGLIGNDQENNNSSGFSALPGGVREPTGIYLDAGANSYYWTSTSGTGNVAFFRLLDFDVPTLVTGSIDKNSGLSVRCVKD